MSNLASKTKVVLVNMVQQTCFSLQVEPDLTNSLSPSVIDTQYKYFFCVSSLKKNADSSFFSDIDF